MLWWTKFTAGVAALLVGIGGPVVLSTLGSPVALSFVAVSVGLAFGAVSIFLGRVGREPVEGMRLRRLSAFSDELVRDIGRNFDGRLYVQRDIEPKVLDDALKPDGPLTQILSGEAGSGKTSMLWHLHQTVTDSQPDCDAVLMSAAWLVPDDVLEAPLTPDEILDELRLTPTGRQTLVLFDTVDILLHADQTRTQILEFIRAMNAEGFRVVLSTRPEEQRDAIPTQLGTVVHLGKYSATELPIAVENLASFYCPDVDSAVAVDDILQATARGLPVREVCERPLLLRMLFELSSPEYPYLAETDVTGLYQMYWDYRVHADERLGTSASDGLSTEVDLTAHAGVLAVVMLALASPEPPKRAVLDQGSRELQTVPDAEPIDFRRGLQKLTERGVASQDNSFVRFFHQTMFEFAAAKGIIRRSRDGDLNLLVERVLANPEDLFVGAVLQQLVTLTAANPLHVETVKEAVVRLMESGSADLIAIGCGIAAHHPMLLASRLDLVSTLSSQQKGRLVEQIAATYRTDVTQANPVIRQVWKGADRQVRLMVARAMRRLVETHGEAAASLARELGLIGHFSKLDPAALGDIDLLQLLPRVTRPGDLADVTQVCEMLTALDVRGRNLLIEQVTLLASKWRECGSPALFQAVMSTLDRLIMGRESDGRSLRHAVGDLIFASYSATSNLEADSAPEWEELAETAGSVLDSNEADWRAGSTLFALVRACMASDDIQFVDSVVSRVLKASPFEAGKRIATHFLAPLAAATGTISRERVGERLRAFAQALPIQPGAARTRTEQWAVMARVVLEDEQMRPTDVVAIAGQVARLNPDLWLQREGLVSVLAASASGGDQSAVEILEAIKRDPATLDAGAQSKFMNAAQRHLDCEPVAAAFAAIGVRYALLGRLTVAAAFPTAATALKPYSAQIQNIIQSGVRGKPKEQRLAANLWATFSAAGILQSSTDSILEGLDEARSAIARRTLLALLPSSLAREPQRVASTLDRLRDPAHREPRAARTAGDAQGDEQDISLLDDGFKATLLEAICLAQAPAEANWEEIMALANRSRPGVNAVRTDAFKPVNRYLTRLADVDPAIACARLIDVGRRIKEPLYSVPQQQQIAFNLAYSIRASVLRADDDALKELADGFTDVPYKYAEALIRGMSQNRRKDSLRHLRRAASVAGQHAEIETYLALNLHDSSRQVGLNTFHEILS